MRLFPSFLQSPATNSGITTVNIIKLLSLPSTSHPVTIHLSPSYYVLYGPEFEFRHIVENFNVQAGCWYPSSLLFIWYWVSVRGYSGRNVRQSTHLHLFSEIRMRGIMPLFHSAHPLQNRQEDFAIYRLR
jgi:hypothetical protein